MEIADAAREIRFSDPAQDRQQCGCRRLHGAHQSSSGNVFIERYRGSFTCLSGQRRGEIFLHSNYRHQHPRSPGVHFSDSITSHNIPPSSNTNFIECNCGSFRTAANAWGNFARSQTLHISTSYQGRYIADTSRPYRRYRTYSNCFR